MPENNVNVSAKGGCDKAVERFAEEEIKYLSVELPEEIKYYKYSGDFDGELAAIGRCLRRDLPHALRRRLFIESVIAAAMKSDYLLSADDVIARVAGCYPHFDLAALGHCREEGYADFILRGGETYYQNSAATNILNCCGGYLRSLEGDTALPEPNEFRLENIRMMRERGSRAFKFHVRMSLRVKSEAERPGELLRIHLPYARECEEQSEVTLIASSDPVMISSGAQCTAYIEAPCEPGKEYFVEYSYVNRAIYREPDPDAAVPGGCAEYLSELAPHIVFTPFLRALAADIAGDEKNPLILAHRVYDWVTLNVRYTYMRRYICLENIAENAALSRHGDCGVQSLLFITLCRILGIPARWQSGCAIRPGHFGDHDWAQFYVAPYGWLYADPSYGGGAARSGDGLSHGYYFGNLDCFRLIANSEFQAPFSPPKSYIRCDPYDNQDGEAEYLDRGLLRSELETDKTLISSEEVDVH